MRIGLISHQWPGARLGGVGAYTWNCARGLAEAGHEVHVFTLALPKDVRDALPPGVILHEAEEIAERVASERLSGILAAAVEAAGEATHRLAIGAMLCEQVRRVHEKVSLDVVEGPEYEALGLALLLPPPPSMAVVTHVHSGSAIARLSGNPWAAASPEQSLKEALEFATIASADGWCAATQQVVRDTADAYGLEKLPGRASGILPLPFLTEEKYEEAPKDGAALYVGRLEFLKGAHLLAEAANGFLKKNPGATIRLAGPDTATAPDKAGSMAKWMREKLAPEVKDRVAFLGERNRAELQDELRRCAFVVAPSLFDNFPYVCCEAMGAGRPVITSRGIGAAELVGEAGITFTRGDAEALSAAMEQMWRDSNLRQRLGQTAYKRIHEELSAKQAIQTRVAMYEQVMQHLRTAGRKSLGENLARMRGADVAAILTALVEQTGSLAGVMTVARKTPGTRLTEILDAVHNGKPTQAWLYGAGRHTSRLLAEKHLWEAKGHRIVGIIDDHPRFAEAKVHLGLQVQSRAAVEKGDLLRDAVVVLSTDTFIDQFWQQTAAWRARGVRVFKLYE